MKIVIDEDLPRSLSAALRADSHEVFDIRDHSLRGASDDRVFHFAQERCAALMSGDRGFANIRTFPLGAHYGIIVLRFPSELDTAYVNGIVVNLTARLNDQDIRGNLAIFSPRGIRIRRQRRSS